MDRRIKYFVPALFTLLFWSSLSFAQDNKSAQFGLVYGFSVTDADNTKDFKLMGAKASAFVSPNFSFGGYYLVSDSSGQPSSENKFTYSLHGVEATYHFGGAGGDTFAGVRAGLSKVSQNPSGNDVTFSPYHYGLVTGHDFHFGSRFSMGVEGSYIYVEKGRTTLDGAIYERNSFSVISFLISLQLRM